MKRASFSLLLATAALGTAGCSIDQVLLQDGASSALAVRVYVDANGNGSFDAEDVPIASVTITAQGPGTALTATTDGTGLASFQLPPGSYSLSAAGAAPAGAVLASAAKPTVVAPFQGESLTSEFRYSFFPGGVSGVVYRDDDTSGDFDPAEDTPAPGIQVNLYAGSAVGGDVLSSTNTDNGGAFTFPGLRPGTYTIDVIPFPTIEIVGGNSQTITVNPQGDTDVLVEFTGSLVVSVSEFRDSPDGSPAAIEGVVSWQAPFDTRVYFLQDGTAGIAAFDFTNPTLAIGDSIRVTGAKNTFRVEAQISNVTSVEVFANVGEPAPRAVSAAAINAGAFQGQLVTIDATVDSITVDGFGSQTVFLTDGAGGTFIVFGDNRTGVMEGDWVVGSPYSVTGVLGTDDRTSNFPLPHRIEVRSPDDVVQGVSTIPIADARQMDGQAVTVEGIVTWQAQWDSRVYFFQDETAGIAVFDLAGPTLQEGDRIRVDGVISSFRGEVQISPTAVSVISQETVPLPLVVTAAQINAGQFQAQLVTLRATVDSLTVDGFGSQTVFLTNGAGETFLVFGDNRTGVMASDWMVGAGVTVTGVLGTDDRISTFPLPHRVEVRRPEDIGMAVPTVTLAAARGMDGMTVTVEGVVTWQAQWDSRVYFFEDGTAGIAVFDSNSPMLEIGYRIQVTGTIGSFRGEVQLSPSAPPTVIGQQPLPDPREVTAAEINAGQFQGELVKITATVDSLTADMFDNQTVFLTDDAGETFTVYGDSRNGAGSDAWTVDVPHTVIGVLGTDDRDMLPHRIEVRGPDDIQFGGTAISLASARGMDGATVVVEGVVTWQAQWDSRIYFFQDGTGGIAVFDFAGPTLARGDRIRVLGTIGSFRGEVQISPSALRIVESGFEPPPRTVTAAEINAGMFQGELVTVSATVDSLTVDGFGSQTVFLSDGAGETFLVFGDNRTGVLESNWTIGASVIVSGVLGTDDRTSNFPLPHRIEVRDPADIQEL